MNRNAVARRLRALMPALVPFVVFAFAGLGLANTAQAQDFPTKPLRIIIAYGPIGLVDFVPRALAAGMAPLLGQQINVENRPGGMYMPAISEVLRSPADGYTMFV